MLTIRLLWYIRVLEVRARIARPRAQDYLKAHANLLKHVVLVKDSIDGAGDKVDRQKAYRSLFELSLTFIDTPDFLNTKAIFRMIDTLEAYITIKYEKRES